MHQFSTNSQNQSDSNQDTDLDSDDDDDNNNNNNQDIDLDSDDDDDDNNNNNKYSIVNGNVFNDRNLHAWTHILHKPSDNYDADYAAFYDPCNFLDQSDNSDDDGYIPNNTLGSSDIDSSDDIETLNHKDDIKTLNHKDDIETKTNNIHYAKYLNNNGVFNHNYNNPSDIYSKLLRFDKHLMLEDNEIICFNDDYDDDYNIDYDDDYNIDDDNDASDEIESYKYFTSLQNDKYSSITNDIKDKYQVSRMKSDVVSRSYCNVLKVSDPTHIISTYLSFVNAINMEWFNWSVDELSVEIWGGFANSLMVIPFDKCEAGYIKFSLECSTFRQILKWSSMQQKHFKRVMMNFIKFATQDAVKDIVYNYDKQKEEYTKVQFLKPQSIPSYWLKKSVQNIIILCIYGNTAFKKEIVEMISNWVPLDWGSCTNAQQYFYDISNKYKTGLVQPVMFKHPQRNVLSSKKFHREITRKRYSGYFSDLDILETETNNKQKRKIQRTKSRARIRRNIQRSKEILLFSKKNSNIQKPSKYRNNTRVVITRKRKHVDIIPSSSDEDIDYNDKLVFRPYIALSNQSKTLVTWTKHIPWCNKCLNPSNNIDDDDDDDVDLVQTPLQ